MCIFFHRVWNWKFTKPLWLCLRNQSVWMDISGVPPPIRFWQIQGEVMPLQWGELKSIWLLDLNLRQVPEVGLSNLGELFLLLKLFFQKRHLLCVITLILGSSILAYDLGLLKKLEVLVGLWLILQLSLLGQVILIERVFDLFDFVKICLNIIVPYWMQRANLSVMTVCLLITQGIFIHLIFYRL